MPVRNENSAPVTVATTLTITSAATSQQVFANSTRNYLLIQNNSDTDMWLGVGGVPTIGSGIRLLANGGGWIAESEFIPSGAVNIICSAVGKAFYAIQG